ncbi:MAG: YcgN family cysteine cluster protein [Pseudomonadota bacterium]
MTDQPDNSPFWKTKSLREMSSAEWESLCDGCGKCCLHKLQDEDTDEVFYTTVGCLLFDCTSCRCKDYPNRSLLVPDCVILSPDNLDELSWMPSTCAYRLINEGTDLLDWHPLVTGNPDSTRLAGMSVSGRVVSEKDAHPDLSRYLADWPS